MQLSAQRLLLEKGVEATNAKLREAYGTGSVEVIDECTRQYVEAQRALADHTAEERKFIRMGVTKYWNTQLNASCCELRPTKRIGGLCLATTTVTWQNTLSTATRYVSLLRSGSNNE